MAPRACVRVYARVLVPPNLYIHSSASVCLLQAVAVAYAIPAYNCLPQKQNTEQFVS